MVSGAETLNSKLGLDSTDFKLGIQTANRELRVLESSFRASASTLGDWGNSISGLELRQKSLTDQIGLQKSKVEALRAEHQRLVEANGATSISAQNAEIKLNKETERLGKMQTELSGTDKALDDLASGNVDAGKSAQEMGEKVEKSGSKVETFKSILGGVGKVAAGVVAGIAAVGAGAIAAVAMMAGLGFKAAETADNLADMSAKTGISTTRLQELGYAGKILGTDLETITGANAKLIRSMASAHDGAGAQRDAFRELGVKVSDAHGKLRDSQAVMGDVFDALSKIQNPAERDALAMSLFGKSAQELNPLIAAGSAGMADLADQAHRMGAVMSEEDVAAAGAFQDQLDGLKLGFQGVLAQIGLAFIPGMAGIAGKAKGYLEQLVGVVQGSGGDINKMLNGFWVKDPEGGQEFQKGIMGVVTQIVQDLTAQLPQLATVGLGILTSILTAIIGALPTLVTAAIGIVSSLVGFLVQNLPMLITAAVGILTSLVGILVQNLPMIMQAGIQLLLTLVTAIIGALPSLIGAAFQMIITLVQGIAAALPTLIPAIVEMLVLIIQTIVDNLPMLLQAALELILGLVQGLAAALPILIKAVPTILIAIVNALTAMLPMLVEMAPQIIVALITGIIGALPALGAAVPEIIKTIVSVLTDLLPDMGRAGWAILRGIWDGIAAQLPWFWAQIKAFALNIWTEIKKALGIHSPSSLFAETVGPFIPAGIWKGIEGGMPKLQDQLAAAMRGLTASYDVAVNGRMGAFAPVGVGAGASLPGLPSSTIHETHLHVGTLIADRRGLEELERTLKGIRMVEDVRSQ